MKQRPIISKSAKHSPARNPEIFNHTMLDFNIGDQETQVYLKIRQLTDEENSY